MYHLFIHLFLIIIILCYVTFDYYINFEDIFQFKVSNSSFIKLSKAKLTVMPLVYLFQNLGEINKIVHFPGYLFSNSKSFLFMLFTLMLCQTDAHFNSQNISIMYSINYSRSNLTDFRFITDSQFTSIRNSVINFIKLKK